MKVKMITSTNSAFSPLFGVQMELNIEMVAYMSFNPEDVNDFDFRQGTARTSSIVQVHYLETSMNCYEITVETRNSVYTFQKGEPSDKKPLTKKEILELQIAAGMHLF